MTSHRPRLLDLFCGAGGAARGYQLAGFHVTGIDHRPQPRYVGDKFVLGDALEYLAQHGAEFDAIHASPPCQAYSSMVSLYPDRHYPRLIPPLRAVLDELGKPYVIENVERAKPEMPNALTLCGTMFGLRVRRHRLFQCSPPIYFPPASCRHWLKTAKQGRRPDPEKEFICITGRFSGQDYARRAMQIHWMRRTELTQAIPPAYTEWIGLQLLAAIRHLP